MFRVLVPSHFHDELRRRNGDDGVTFVPYDKDGVPLADASDAAALFRWWISTEQGDLLVRTCPIRWIHSGSAGVDHFLTPVLRERPIVVTNSSGVHAPSIAEWVVLGMLAQEKQLASMLRQQAMRVFEKVQRDELDGKSVVILGTGHIGTEIASRLQPFGVRLTGARRTTSPHPLFHRVVALSDRSAIADADWLIVALPLTESTRGLVDGNMLAALPKRCRLVNVARGEIVVEDALIEALRKGSIAGAVLDVFEQEPLPADHPFWEMENVIVLPHTTWRSPQVQERQISLFIENLRRFRANEPLLNRVDLEVGY